MQMDWVFRKTMKKHYDLRLAADQGDAAQAVLVAMYAQGQGVPQDFKSSAILQPCC